MFLSPQNYLVGSTVTHAGTAGTGAISAVTPLVERYRGQLFVTNRISSTFGGGTLAFALPAARRIRVLAVVGLPQAFFLGSGQLQWTLRSGGAGGTVVGTSDEIGTLDIRTWRDFTRVMLTTAIDATADHVHLTWQANSLARLQFLRVWAGDWLDMRALHPGIRLGGLDASLGERSGGAIYYATEGRRRRTVTASCQAARTSAALTSLSSDVESLLELAAREGGVTELLVQAADSFLWQMHGRLASRPVVDRADGPWNTATLSVVEY